MTQSALIAPLQDYTFRPWSKEGFTFTSWIKLGSNASPLNSNGIRLTNEDEWLSESGSHQCICRHNLHFLSIGTSSMMLSAYICTSSTSTIFFQLSSPIAQASRSLSKSQSEHFRCSEIVNGTKKAKCICSALRKRRASSKREFQDIQTEHDQRPQRRPTRSKERRHNRENTEENISPASTPITSTVRMALKSSLSQFNIFSSSRNSEKESEAANFGVPVFIKGLKLNRNRWMLFSLSATFTGTGIKIRVSVDNSLIGNTELPCSVPPIDPKKEKFNIICLGHRLPPHVTLQNHAKKENTNASPETDVNAINFKYSLSNALLLKSTEINSEVLAHLFAMGPDCVNFAQCQVGNLIPNIGIPATNNAYTSLDVDDALKCLQERILLVYSAHRPSMIIGYPTPGGE